MKVVSKLPIKLFAKPTVNHNDTNLCVAQIASWFVFIIPFAQYFS